MYLVAKKWKKLPPGWTDKSVDKFWKTLTKGTPEHKVWDCISKMEEPFGDGAGAFCGGLADWKMPGWRQKNKKEDPSARSDARKYWKGKIKKNKKAAKKRKAIYTGLFLSSSDMSALKKWWQKTVGTGTLPRRYMHHITLAFKPSVDDVLSLAPYIGQTIPVKIIGWAEDEHAQAVTISCQADICSANKHPHITVATDPSTKPAYSNTLLNKGPIHKVSGPTLKLRVGFFNGKEDRFDLTGTIYEDLI